MGVSRLPVVRKNSVRLSAKGEEFIRLQNKFAKKEWLRMHGVIMSEHLWNDVTPGREDLARQRQEERARRMYRLLGKRVTAIFVALSVVVRKNSAHP